MSPKSLLAALLLPLVACTADEPEPPPPPPPEPATLADFSGNWSATATIDTQSVAATIGGDTTPSSWAMTLNGSEPIQIQTVSLRGDSMILISQKYPSVLRTGSMTQVRMAAVITPAGMAGEVIATYDNDEGQDVASGSFTAVRAPSGP